MIELLISTTHHYPGAGKDKCDLCNATVWEDPKNLERIRNAPEAYLICMACGVELKLQHPELAIEAQMWEGKLREPEPLPEFKKLSDWLSKKG